MIPETATLRGGGASLLRYLFVGLLLALVFPVGIYLGPIRIVSADVFLIPLSAIAAFAFTQAPYTGRRYFGEFALLFLIGFLWVSSLASLKPWTSIDLWAIWARACLFFFVVRRLLNLRVISVRDVYTGLTIVWFILLFVGIVQIVTGSDFGLLANYVGRGASYRSAFQDVRRVSGTTSEANVYGQWLVTLSLLINARLLLPRTTWRRLELFLVLVVVELVVLLGTLSRANIGLFLISHAFLVFLWIRRSSLGGSLLKSTLTTIALGVFVAGGTYLYFAGGAIATLALRFQEAGLRVLQIQHGLQLLRHPKIFALGTGLGTFYPTLASLGIQVSSVEAWHFAGARTGIHNGVFLVLVEGGTAAGLFFVAFSIVVLIAGYRAMLKTVGTSFEAMTTGLWLVLLFYMAVALQLYMSAVNYPMIFFLMLFAALAFHFQDNLPDANGKRLGIPSFAEIAGK